ncbi:MAG: AAA family ATPase, partial [Polyangiaceae bacterium]
HFQRYPVIHFNFKGSKGATAGHCLSVIRQKIIDAYEEHRPSLEGRFPNEVMERRFRQILNGNADSVLYERALLDLSSLLHDRHGERVVILIDEYDEPIHSGHLQGYGKEILDFMRSFLGAALKSNPHLHRAVMTGILRVAKENLFSGLNNLDVYTLLARRFNTAFGFTEAEVAALLARSGHSDRLAEVRAWYNGYVFGGEVIYNPWSVCNYLSREGDGPQAYWLSTSSNDLVKELLERYAIELQPVFETLMSGGSFERRLDDNVALAELRQSVGALFSLLTFSGYLKADKAYDDPLLGPVHRLSIPNTEVRQVYSTTFAAWMERRMSGLDGVDRLTRALLAGDAERMEEQLGAFVTNLLSYHDPGSLDPERVYHGFLVGLLAVMEGTHEVRSNRESGEGRPDVQVRPRRPGLPGAVLELKVARRGKKTLKQALSDGLSQLAGMDYGAELRSAGATPIHAFAVAFDGKQVRVAAAKPEKTRSIASKPRRSKPRSPEPRPSKARPQEPRPSKLSAPKPRSSKSRPEKPHTR